MDGYKRGYIGRNYDFQLAANRANATLSEIKFKYDINSFEHFSESLELNEIARVQIRLDKKIPFEPYQECPSLGSFVLVDRYSNATVAAGMIRFELRRASNLHKQNLSVDRIARERIGGPQRQGNLAHWSIGAGKSTIANAAETILHAQGFRTYILDGDNIRHGLTKDLGFTVADRVENIKRIAEVAKLFLDAGVIVMTSVISPFKAERDMARGLFDEGDFMEVFIDVPFDIAESRDPKGLYKKARVANCPTLLG